MSTEAAVDPAADFDVNIMWAVDDSGPIGYWVNGHVNIPAFVQFLNDEWTDDPNDADEAFTRHIYLRKVPDRTGEWNWRANFVVNGSTRGAAPITYFDLQAKQIAAFESRLAPHLEKNSSQEDGR